MIFSLLFTFHHNITKAFIGSVFWKRLVKKKQISAMTLVLLLPKGNDSYSYFFIAHLTEYVSHYGYENVLILTDNDLLPKLFKYLDYTFSEVILLNKNKFSCLLKFVSICKLLHSNSGFIIGDLVFPNDRKSCLNFLKFRNITVEQLICTGVYGLVPFEPRKIEVDEKEINETLVLDFLSSQQ